MYRVSLKYSRVVSVAYPKRRGIATYVLFPAVRPPRKMALVIARKFELS